MCWQRHISSSSSSFLIEAWISTSLAATDERERGRWFSRHYIQGSVWWIMMTSVAYRDLLHTQESLTSRSTGGTHTTVGSSGNPGSHHLLIQPIQHIDWHKPRVQKGFPTLFFFLVFVFTAILQFTIRKRKKQKQRSRRYHQQLLNHNANCITTNFFLVFPF